MKIIIGLTLITGFVLSSFSYAEIKAPDQVVTKADIKKCLKHLRDTEEFLYPQSLKVESAHYTQKNSKILLTLSISEKTEYGGNASVQEKQCTLDKLSKSNKETKPRNSSKKATKSTGSSYSYGY